MERSTLQSSDGKRQTIVLIGPHCIGISDVADLLATGLGVPLIDLWDISKPYWTELGFQEKDRKRAWEANKADGYYEYMMPFAAHAILRGVVEHANCVIRLAEMQSIYTDDALLKKVADTLKPHKVVLMVPSKEMTESLAYLRLVHSDIVLGKEMNEHFLTHRSNNVLAKYTFYTKSKTPEQTCEEILSKIDMSASDIILIGAIGAGKSTIGKLLSEELGLPQISMDELRWRYYKEKGWSEKQQEEIAENQGFSGVYHYWKQFDILAVERLLDEHHNCVIDFGAGHSIYENNDDFQRAQELLAPYANVILLMPSPSVEESVTILRQRSTLTINGMDFRELMLSHPSNTMLADLVVFTKGKTPVEIQNEIFRFLE